MAHFKMGHYSIFAFMEEKRCIQENNKRGVLQVDTNICLSVCPEFSTVKTDCNFLGYELQEHSIQNTLHNTFLSPILKGAHHTLHPAPSSLRVSICLLFCSVTQPIPRRSNPKKGAALLSLSEARGSYTFTHAAPSRVLVVLKLSDCKSNRSAGLSWISQ